MADYEDYDRQRRRLRGSGKFVRDRDYRSHRSYYDNPNGYSRNYRNHDYIGYKDFENDTNITTMAPNATATKKPIILTKSSTLFEEDNQENDASRSNKSNAVDGRGEAKSISGVPDIPSLLSSEIAMPPGVQPAYQIKKNPGGVDTKAKVPAKLAPMHMTSSVRLVDDSMNWCENGIEHLSDQSDLLVMGVLGLQGSGKSTLLSALAAPKHQPVGKHTPFRSQGVDNQGTHQSVGVQMYVTDERVIMLDTQPVLSSSVLDHLFHNDKKFPNDYNSADNCVEMQSLHLASFLITTCHVIVVVLDWFVDVNLIKLLNTAETLRPAAANYDSTSRQEPAEKTPHIVFVLNKAPAGWFTADNYVTMQRGLRALVRDSRLQHSGAVTMAHGNLIPGLGKDQKGHVNLFIIPDVSKEDTSCSGSVVTAQNDVFVGRASTQRLLHGLRKQLYSLPRHPLTSSALSEKNWFHYAARSWEAVKKSTLMSEYSRLLP